MTVAGADTEDQVECQWFDGHKLERSTFHEDQLEVTSPHVKGFTYA